MRRKGEESNFCDPLHGEPLAGYLPKLKAFANLEVQTCLAFSSFLAPPEFHKMRLMLQATGFSLNSRIVACPAANESVSDAYVVEKNTSSKIFRYSVFPVIADNKDEVVGILLAKDLLKFSKDGEDSFEMDSFLRPATFIPESKRLKTLLREFRKSRNHIAIVVDEYGRTAGLLTIEDVLEQIVGDIEDEYDIEDVPLIKEVKKNKFIVDALIRIEDFNEFFDTEFLDEDYDTLGGLLTQTIGRLPKKNEIVDLKSIRCKIIESNTRRIDTVEVARID